MVKNNPDQGYPKFIFLLITFFLAFIIFKERNVPFFHEFLSSLGFFGTFFAGTFFVYGFTAAPATAILLILGKEQNIIMAGLIAGLGALVGDLVIFKFIKHSFADEIEKFSKEKSFKYLKKKIPGKLKKYLIVVLGGFIIASPLPDEIGVSLLAATSSISTRTFSIISYMMNTAGILIILLIGNKI